MSVKTKDYVANEQLRAELAAAQTRIAEFEKAERDRLNDEFERRLDAQRAEKQAAQQLIEDDRKAAERIGLVRPMTKAGFLGLSQKLRCEYYRLYGPDFLGDVMRREAMGCSWNDYDLLRRKEQALEAED